MAQAESAYGKQEGTKRCDRKPKRAHSTKQEAAGKDKRVKGSKRALYEVGATFTAAAPGQAVVDVSQ